MDRPTLLRLLESDAKRDGVSYPTPGVLPAALAEIRRLEGILAYLGVDPATGKPRNGRHNGRAGKRS